LIFLKGFIIGISIAAPVGPIGILCIQRTITYGKLNGLATGLGAASADAVYGFIAAFGLTFISNFLVDQQTWFRIIGGAFLIYLGSATWWLFLSAGANLFRNKLNQRLAWINKLSGVLITLFGVVAIGSFLIVE
jgi:threonine/homoserine/homoserine lactone efflux protein